MSSEEEIEKLVRKFGENWQTNKHYLNSLKEWKTVRVTDEGTEEDGDIIPTKPKGVKGVDYHIGWQPEDE